jgi:hypothetical protein
MSQPLTVLSASVARGVADMPAIQLAATLAQWIVPALLRSSDEAVERDRHVAGGIGHQHLLEAVADCVAITHSNYIRHRWSMSPMSRPNAVPEADRQLGRVGSAAAR